METRKERETSRKDTIDDTNVLHGCWCRLEKNKQLEALDFLLSYLNSISSFVSLTAFLLFLEIGLTKDEKSSVWDTTSNWKVPIFSLFYQKSCTHWYFRFSSTHVSFTDETQNRDSCIFRLIKHENRLNYEKISMRFAQGEKTHSDISSHSG